MRASCAISVFATLLTACQASDDAAATSDSDAGVADGTSLTRALTLPLVAEKKLTKLLPTKQVDHYEASGVVASGGMLYVAFDNLTNIAAIDTSLGKGTLGPGEAVDSQYEAITASTDGRFFAMVEATTATAEVAEFDAATAFVEQRATNVTFPHANKGFEGAAWLQVGDAEYLLALCENNNCKDDDTAPGKGRAQLLLREGDVWVSMRTLKLPESAAFLDYSDIALQSNGDGTYAAAVVSHKSSALWLGTLSTSSWAFTASNTFYVFPRTKDGAVQYCSVEGVTFLGPNVIAVASDKSDGNEPCTDEEESIHIFQMPQ